MGDIRRALHPALRLRIAGGQPVDLRRNQPLERIADLRIGGVAHLLFAVLRRPAAAEDLSDRHLHVGLAGAEPHFADQNVVEGHALLPVGNPDRVSGFARLHRREFGAPFAVFTRFGGHFLSVELDRHGALRIGGAEESDRLLLLEHHVGGEDRIDLEIRDRVRRQKRQRGEHHQKSAHFPSFPC